MKPCRWREPLKKGKHVCRSPRLIGALAGVTPEFCRQCPYVNHDPVAGVALRGLGPCLHLGKETGQLSECQPCPGRVRLKLVECDIHGSIIPTQRCEGCLDFEPAGKLGVPELLAGVDDPLPRQPISCLHDEWAMLPRVRERHIEAFRAMLAREMPRPPAAAGEGILVCGGGRYWPMVALAVRMAREFTTLPIQVWHRGAGEAINPQDLDGVKNVEYRDATRWAARILGGWEVKAVALLHCGWERVLYLDADAYLVGNPEALFATVSADRPLAYWHDYDPWASSIRWEAFGMAAPNKFPLIQGGHLVWHVPGAWRELILSHWLNQHSDYSYRHMYGDQDGWRVAFAATGQAFHCIGPADWRENSFVITYGGRPVIVHRVRDKVWSFLHPNKHHFLPEESRVHRTLERLARGNGPPGEVFTRVYQSGLWEPRGTSGRGSTEVEARPYIEIISRLIAARGWRRVVDLGCGDGWVAGQLRGAQVLGVDCVDVHAAGVSPRPCPVPLQVLDLDRERDKLPAGDAALLKDVLHHWPTSVIEDWVQWAIRSRKWGTLVLTQDRHQGDVEDCELGGYRGLDVTRSPLKDIPRIRLYDEFLHKAVCIVPCP